MWLPESTRQPLNSTSNFSDIDDNIRQQGTLPREALILDEDLPSTVLMQALRAQTPRYKGGRGIVGRYGRIEVSHAGHLFSTTEDRPLLEWCDRHGYVLLTCNVRDFQQLDQQINHSGIIICTNQSYPATNPGKCAKKCDNIFASHHKPRFSNNLFVIP